MPRYIDVDKAKELWNGEHPTQIAMRRIFDDLPTADVAPKSEVEELLTRLTHAYEKIDMAEDDVERLEQDVTRLEQENETLKDNNEHLAVLLTEAKSEVAIEIIQDIAKACAPHDHKLNSLDFEIGYITATNKVLAKLEEIKKKYTEGE